MEDCFTKKKEKKTIWKIIGRKLIHSFTLLKLFRKDKVNCKSTRLYFESSKSIKTIMFDQN